LATTLVPWQVILLLTVLAVLSLIRKIIAG